jgi:hypothetical protein
VTVRRENEEVKGHADLLRRARSYLHHADLVLARLIDERPDFDPRAWLAELPPMDLFAALLFHEPSGHFSRSIPQRQGGRGEAGLVN